MKQYENELEDSERVFEPKSRLVVWKHFTINEKSLGELNLCIRKIGDTVRKLTSSSGLDHRHQSEFFCKGKSVAWV